MILLNDKEVIFTKFPTGEAHVVLADETMMKEYFYPVIKWEWESMDEIFKLALLVGALRGHHKCYGASLVLPYVPFCRQDRICNKGEPHSLKVFCEFINSLKFYCVNVTDPHSDVIGALINNVLIEEQKDVVLPFLKNKCWYYLVSPDAGAAKKIFKLAKESKALGVISFTKERDLKTGGIIYLHTEKRELNGNECVIVDDICDGGATFIGIAKTLKEMGAGRITLMVTHGFFTKGMEVFEGLIDEIYTRKGKVK